MHFLCLHGIGTNSRILETQLAAIRHELGDYHTYEYVEGVHPCPIAPELASFFPSEDDHFVYFNPEYPSTFAKALDDLENFIAVEGPFDGVLAFSQGAQLAASLLARTHRRDPSRQLFSCAVFFCGVVPCEYDGSNGNLRDLDPATNGQPITIPTANIWGSNDESFPGKSQILSRLCREDWNTVFVHSGGHEIPGLSSKGDLFGSVKAIRRVVNRALTIQ